MSHDLASDAFYAAHEYLGENFGPLMFEQVARDMQHARCSFIGSIESTDAMAAYWAPPDLVPVIEQRLSRRPPKAVSGAGDEYTCHEVSRRRR